VCFVAERTKVAGIENWVEIELKHETTLFDTISTSLPVKELNKKRENERIILMLKRVKGHKYGTQRSEVKKVTVGLWIRIVFIASTEDVE
jgi:hypothetical protein